MVIMVLLCTESLFAASLPDIDGNRRKYRVIYINSDDNDVPTGMAIYRAADAGLIELVAVMGCADDRARLLAPTLQRAKTCLSNLPGSVLSGSDAVNKIEAEINNSTANDPLIIFNGGWYDYLSKGLTASNSSKREYCYVYQIFMSGKDMDNTWGYHESKHPSQFEAVKSSGANIIFCPTIHPCGSPDRINSVGVDFNCKALDDHYSWLIKDGGSCFKRGHQQDADGVMMLIFHHSYVKSVEKQGTCYIIKDADASASYGNYNNISAAWKAIAAGNYKKAHSTEPPANLRACIEIDRQAGEAPLTVSVDGTCSQPSDDATISSYSWDFGNGQTATGATAAHTFTVAGQHPIVLTVSDSKGQQDRDTLNVEALPAPDAGVIRINAGGENFVDTQGNLWITDAHFVGGNSATKSQVDIANTEIDQLYYTERYGMDSYSIPVSNGTHTVRLHFCEQYTGITSAGQRTFDISVEATVLQGFDVFQEAGGRQKAVVKEFTVSVDDGAVDISFTRDMQNPMINGIEVIEESAVAAEPQNRIRNISLQARLQSDAPRQYRIFSIHGKYLGTARSRDALRQPPGVYIIEGGSRTAGANRHTQCKVR